MVFLYLQPLERSGISPSISHTHRGIDSVIPSSVSQGLHPELMAGGHRHVDLPKLLNGPFGSLALTCHSLPDQKTYIREGISMA
jgi:hypothetical protein